MNPDNNEENELQIKMQERFEQLPKQVQEAITSADMEKHLRELADKHKLHLDQWTALENEVMLALLGFQKTSDIAKNIKSEVGLTDEVATALAADISEIVFKPIRAELERVLEHPDAKAAGVSDTEAVRAQILSGNAAAIDAAAPAPAAAPAVTQTVAPGTPPAPAPTAQAERAALPESYTTKASHERAEIAGDPYREQVA